jgi:predicted ester cyclase
MSLQQHKALVRQHFEEIWNQGNVALVDELFASNFMVGDEYWGPEGERQWVVNARVAFPDIHFSIESQVAEGDLVVTRWSWRGTHQGTFLGIAATGRRRVLRDHHLPHR